MPSPHDYRLYQLDREGHIVRADVIRCENDVEAVRTTLVLALKVPHPIELWCRSRYVGQFPSAATKRAVAHRELQFA